MTTYLMSEDEADKFYEYCVKDAVSLSNTMMKIAMLGLEEIDLEEAKRKANVGDCILIQYANTMVPFQVIDKEVTKLSDGTEKVDCIIQSYYVIDDKEFDKKTNVWRDASIRKHLNGNEFMSRFSSEFIAALKPTEVHTSDYVTLDKFWLPSHEEMAFEDENNTFVKNVGTKAYAYYLDKMKRVGNNKNAS